MVHALEGRPRVHRVLLEETRPERQDGLDRSLVWPKHIKEVTPCHLDVPGTTSDVLDPNVAVPPMASSGVQQDPDSTPVPRDVGMAPQQEVRPPVDAGESGCPSFESRRGLS